jgi:hypothetical protein
MNELISREQADAVGEKKSVALPGAASPFDCNFE